MKEFYGDLVEFANDDGQFNLENFDDHSEFEVMGNHSELRVSSTTFSTPNVTLNNSATATASHSTPRSSAKKLEALAKVKIIKGVLNSNGKPQAAQQSPNPGEKNCAIINIYSEEDACVNFITLKMRHELRDATLQMTDTNGIIFADQEGTRGTLCVSFCVDIFKLTLTDLIWNRNPVFLIISPGITQPKSVI